MNIPEGHFLCYVDQHRVEIEDRKEGCWSRQRIDYGHLCWLVPRFVGLQEQNYRLLESRMTLICRPYLGRPDYPLKISSRIVEHCQEIRTLAYFELISVYNYFWKNKQRR